MPSTVTCNFAIPANANTGSRLQGAGFGVANQLNGGDSLQVVVTWGGNNPPNSLNGYFIFSPAEGAGSSQGPSPFFNGSNYLCFQEQVANKSASGQQYAFTPFTVPTGSAAGNYELTVVVEDARATPSTQWSEDPEFDTTGG
jgi:hypothetical protein